jgi:hypothetical protein
MVERIERFKPELDHMILVIGKLESLVQRQIDRLEMRCGHGIPADIAEGSGGCFDKGRGVEPMRGSAVRSVSVADTGVVGPVGSLIAGAGVVDTADRKGLRNSALKRHARAQIPAAK